MGFIKEFKEFAVKGNMLEMAIGIILGLAFNAIVNSLVKDIIMPLLGYIIGEVNFNDLEWVLKEEQLSAEGQIITEAVIVRYGNFIQQSFDFLVIALSIFLVVKTMNQLKTKAEDVKQTEIATPKNIELLNEINEGIQKLNSK